MCPGWRGSPLSQLLRLLWALRLGGGGDPEISCRASRADRANARQTVPDQFKCDLEVERMAIGRFNRMIALSVQVGDNGTRQLLEQMLVSEQEHEHWLESQLQLIRQGGDANYLTSQIRKPGAE
jgi:bacterioferritin (cytochrome b1)